MLDNSGYELFSDLCLVDALLRSGRVTMVTLHQKAIPWFVSDVTQCDFDSTLSDLQSKFLNFVSGPDFLILLDSAVSGTHLSSSKTPSFF